MDFFNITQRKDEIHMRLVLNEAKSLDRMHSMGGVENLPLQLRVRGPIQALGRPLLILHFPFNSIHRRFWWRLLGASS